MPKINSPDQVSNLLPNLPRRLRELRLEMGWSLDDLVPIVGVTQKGVVSNWEATNQRRRTPPVSTLMILQRWYGVSLDYLVGNPNAEKESPAVKAGKAALKDRLKKVEGLDAADPSERARIALKLAVEVAPAAFFLDRAVAYLAQSRDDLEEMLKDRLWADVTLSRLGEFLGLTSDWFYSTEPASVLNKTQ